MDATILTPETTIVQISVKNLIDIEVVNQQSYGKVQSVLASLRAFKNTVYSDIDDLGPLEAMIDTLESVKILKFTEFNQ